MIVTYPIIFANVTLVTTNDQISSNNYRSLEMALMTPSVIDFLLNYRNLEKKQFSKWGLYAVKVYVSLENY